MKNIKAYIFFIFKQDMQTLIYYTYKHFKHFTFYKYLQIFTKTKLNFVRIIQNTP